MRRRALERHASWLARPAQTSDPPYYSGGAVTAPASGSFGFVARLTPDYLESLRPSVAPGAVAAAPAEIWGSTCSVVDYGDGTASLCVPIHYAKAVGEDPLRMRMVVLARAELALSSGEPLPPGMRSVQEGVRREASCKGGVSPWAYGYLDHADTGHPLLLTDACGGPATLIFPRGSSFVAGSHFPVELLGRAKHAQLVVRDGPPPDLGALLVAGRLVVVDGVVDGAVPAHPELPTNSDSTSEVSLASAFVIDSLAEHMKVPQ